MRTFSIIAVCTTNLLIGLRYVWLVRRGRISPVLAMWVFFTIAVVGSLATYLYGGRLRIAGQRAEQRRSPALWWSSRGDRSLG